MQTGLYAAASSLSALTEQQDTLAFNLAQASTTAYKRRVQTVGSFKEQLRVAGGSMPIPRTQQRIDFSQGALLATGNPLDLAIQNPTGTGSGFLRLETTNGIRYSRGGTFLPAADGSLVNQNGEKLSMTGRIPDPSLPITIDESGLIHQDGKATGARLALVDFTNLEAVIPEGSFRYRADNAGERPSLATIRPGFLERSNADPIDSLVQLITVNRAFEASSKAMNAMSEALQRSTTQT